MDIKTFLNQHHTEQTTGSYLRAIDHFLFHSATKNHSSYADIVSYLSTFDYTSARILCALKRYFDYLLEIGERNDHPCKTLHIKRQRSMIQFQELLSSQELETLLDRPVRYPILEDRNKVILSLLIYQGLSSENIINLNVRDIDLDQGTVYIKATQKLRRRELELKPKQVILIYRYIHSSRKKLNSHHSKKLFLGKLGTEFKVDSLNRMLRPLKSFCTHKKLNAQTIRQSVIANWINEQKIPLEDVQLLSGQKWISTTQNYVKPNSAQRRDVINEFFPL